MSLSKKIAHATQNNYRLNRRVLKMKRSWDEVQCILDTACRKKRKDCCPCSSSCEKTVPSCQKTSPCSCNQKNNSCSCQNRQVNPRSPFYPFF